MFIRTKTVKEKEYAYLVKNVWTKKGPRQKAIKYLGAVIQSPYVKEISFERFILPLKIEELFSKKNPKLVYKALLKRELVRYGFIEIEPNLMQYEDITIALTTKDVIRNGRQVVLKVNEGFICKQTITNLLKHIHLEDETGKKLAEDILEAGISIEKDIFVRLYKMLKD
jgi:hypothetical protein